MNAEQFAHWLRGYSQITNGRIPGDAEWKIIQDELKVVFAGAQQKTINTVVNIPLNRSADEALQSIKESVKRFNEGSNHGQ